MKVVPLWAVDDAREGLSALMTEAWPDHYGPGGVGDAAAELRQRSRKSGLPIGFAAIVDGAPVGTVALAVASHGAEPGERPWLNGLVVAPDMRRRGVASALVAACEIAATEQGFRAIYTSTVSAQGLVQRRGWVRVRELGDGYLVLSKTLMTQRGC